MQKFKIEYLVHGISFSFEVESMSTGSQIMRELSGEAFSKDGSITLDLSRFKTETRVRRTSIDAIRVTEITL